MFSRKAEENLRTEQENYIDDIISSNQTRGFHVITLRFVEVPWRLSMFQLHAN